MLHGTLQRYIAHATAALTVAAACVFALTVPSGCTCTTHHADGNTSAADEDREVSAILDTPVPFDRHNVNYWASVALADTLISDPDMARMTVAAESAVAELGSTVDALAANDDPADTYNVLTELTAYGWPAQTYAMAAYLAECPEPFASRAEQIRLSLDRISTTILAIAPPNTPNPCATD